MKRILSIAILIGLLAPHLFLRPGNATYPFFLASGYNNISQPVGSINIVSPGTAVPALASYALTGDASTDPANFQAISDYASDLSYSSPLRTLYGPSGLYYVSNLQPSVNTGPITIICQNRDAVVIRETVSTTQPPPGVISAGWTSAAYSGQVTGVNGNQVTTNTGMNYATSGPGATSLVGKIVYNAHGTITMVPPPPAPALALGGAGNVTNGSHVVAVAYYGAGFSNSVGNSGDTPAGPASTPITVTNNAVNGQIVVTVPISSLGAVVGRNIFISLANTSSPLYQVTPSGGVMTLYDNTTATFTINLSDAQLQSPAHGPHTTNTFYVPNYATGVITAGGLNTFTTGGGLSGGLPQVSPELSNAWNVGDWFDIAVDSPPLTIQNCTLDGNFPIPGHVGGQWFLSGICGAGTSGNTVVDSTTNFPNPLPWSVKDFTTGVGGEGNVTRNSSTSFTSSGITWSPGDTYGFTWGNEFDGLVTLAADYGYAGKVTANLTNVKLANGNSRGVYITGNANITASNLYCSFVKSPLTLVEGFNVVTVNGYSDDGNSQGVLDGEVDPGATGYSSEKYANGTYPTACAPNIINFYNMTTVGSEFIEDGPLTGSYCVSNYNYQTVVNGTGAMFFWGGDSQTTNIQNSSFTNGVYYQSGWGNILCQPGTFAITNTTILGTVPVGTSDPGVNGGEYAVIYDSPLVGSLLPSSLSLTNCNINVNPLVASLWYHQGWSAVSAAVLFAPGGSYNGVSTTLSGCTIGSGIWDAVRRNPGTVTLSGGTYNNQGYLYCLPYGVTWAAFALTINNPTFGTGSTGSYIGILSGTTAGSTITQADVVIPVANCEMDVYSNGATWPSNITVSGRKTILGSAAGAPASSLNAFGDDLLGSGNGDYYYDVNGVLYRCTVSGWHDTYTRGGGTNRLSTWVAD
jgi:hypothetical protein